MNNKIVFPTNFDLDLPKENKKYYSNTNKDELINILRIASNDYCMYCGRSIRNDGDIFGQLEHSVDKEGNIGQNDDNKYEYLRNCKYNLSLACPNCNMKCKKIVEKLNLTDVPISINCQEIDCSNGYCAIYSKLRKKYIKQNAIILQPQGIPSKNYMIAFDLLKQVFIPLVDGNEFIHAECSEYDFFLLQNHISKFRLNGDRRTEIVLDICADIVYLYEKGIKETRALLAFFENKHLSNVIGVIFLEYLNRLFCDDEKASRMVKYCKLLVVLDAVE